MKAVWNGEILAESDETILLENNHYFPPSSLNKAFFSASDHTSVCPWKGTAHYYSLSVSGDTNTDAAWFYPEPKEKASEIRGYVAFWRGVQVV